MLLYQNFIKSLYYTWKNIKSLYSNNKFKVSAPTWNEKFGSYSTGCIQDYFKFIFKKHNEKIENSSIRIYLNKIENRITFKIKTGYYLNFLTPETMKFLGCTENKVTKDKNGEDVQHFEMAEVVLVHCNTVNHDYQQDSRVFYKFAPNKPYGDLLEVSSKHHIFLKTFDLEFQAIKVWFTNQNSQPLETEDRINLTLVIK